MNNSEQKIAKIYKLFDNTNGNIYYGSSTEKYLCRRLAKHKHHYKDYLKGKHSYVSSFEIIKNNDFDISLVEAFPYCTKEELHRRERFYIENNQCINKNIPGRTHKERKQKEKDCNICITV
jgi:hypothetical protein